MRRLGIVDLGSNTARLVVFAFDPGRWFRLVDQIRQPVRLGEGLGRGGELTGAAMDRAELALRLFGDYARSTGLPPLEVLATSALRDARNGQEFLHRVEPLGLEISILDGSEEARLGVLAIANSFDLEGAWVVDLGGGSAQLSLMEERQYVEGDALPLGAVRLTEEFLSGDPPTAGEVQHLEEAVDERLGERIDAIGDRALPIVAMGGSVRNLARAVQKMERYPLQDRIHGYFLRREALDGLVDRLLGASARKRSSIPGIKEDRSDVILAGALVYRRLLSRSGQNGLWVSGAGMREGALMRRFLPAPHLVANLRSFSVENLLHHYTQSKEHVESTRRLSSRLFAGLQQLHGFGRREEHLLDAAAVLQDIGLAVNYYRHDRHGAYVVASAPLNGYSHREQALLALLVRFHLRGRPRPGPYESMFHGEDKRLLRTLAACLRLADHLDRPRSQRVRDVEVEVRKSKVVLRAIGREALDLELWQIEQHAPLFRSAFGRRLVVEPRDLSRE